MFVAFLAGGAFYNLMLDTSIKNPPTEETPRSLIMYTDEVTPGNALAMDHSRKVHVMYFSFLEFGPNVLAREDAWFLLFNKRSRYMKDVDSGLTQIVGLVMKVLFGSAVGCSLLTTGFLLQRGAVRVRLWAKLGIVLQDGGAHSTLWHTITDSGSKFCTLCANVYADEADLA